MTNNAIIWVQAASENAADRKINECLRYVLRQLEGFNRFLDDDVQETKHAVHNLVTAATLTEPDTGQEVYIAATRRDNPDRKGKKPRKWVWEATAPDMACSIIVIPVGKDLTSKDVFNSLKRGTDMHMARDGIMLEARDDVEDHISHTVRVLTGTDHSSDALNQGIPHAGGRPPIGCEVEDGMLRPSDDFEHVRRVLLDVRDGQRSKRRAAKKIGCARKTVTNALDRTELYGLGQ